ncbi:MAG: DHH family phosphoesterase, partial [Thermoplasmata archaeon]
MKVILTHSDADGVCAGAIAYSIYPDAEIKITRPSSLLNDLKSLGSNEKIEKIIILDISIDENDAKNILNYLNNFCTKGIEVIYIDHHPLPSLLCGKLPEYIISDTSKSATELSYHYFKNRDMIFVALYGAIGDYFDNTEFVQNTLKDFDKRTIYFEAGLLTLALSELQGFEIRKELIKRLALGVQPCEMNDVVESAIRAEQIGTHTYFYSKKNVKKYGQVSYVLDVPTSAVAQVAMIAAREGGTIVGIGARTCGEEYEMSLRRRSDDVDLNRLLREVAPTVGGRGGGHAA